MRGGIAFLLIAAFVSFAPSYASAQNSLTDVAPPPSLEQIKSIKVRKMPADGGEQTGLPIDIRNDALKEAALSYGARGGLAWRSGVCHQRRRWGQVRARGSERGVLQGGGGQRVYGQRSGQWDHHQRNNRRYCVRAGWGEVCEWGPDGGDVVCF